MCMGSACHQFGAYDVLPQLEGLLVEYGLEDQVKLKGGFCLGDCAHGIVLRCGDVVVTQVQPHNVRQKFVTELLPCLMESEEKVS